MRLTDVARASSHELMGDFINFMMRNSLTAWPSDDKRFIIVINLRLDRPENGANFIQDAMNHISRQLSRFDCFLMRGTPSDAANCHVALCLKINAMLTSMLVAQRKDFKAQGGFAENLTRERLATRRQQAAGEGAPQCPQCGKPMLCRTIQRGSHQGQQFLRCSNYPKCNGMKNA